MAPSHSSKTKMKKAKKPAADSMGAMSGSDADATSGQGK
jgi:hypothetical protein